MHAGVHLFVCVRVCVCGLSFSSCCGESVFAQREVAHNYKFHLQEHKDKDSSGRAKRHPFLVGSWAYTADDYLCVCHGTCEWGKLSHNYTLLSVWPIISLKCERDCSARALLSTMAEDFKQAEEQGLNRVHIIQRENWRRRTHAVHQSASLNTWLWLNQSMRLTCRYWKCLFLSVWTTEKKRTFYFWDRGWFRFFLLWTNTSQSPTTILSVSLSANQLTS